MSEHLRQAWAARIEAAYVKVDDSMPLLTHSYVEQCKNTDRSHNMLTTADFTVLPHEVEDLVASCADCQDGFDEPGHGRYKMCPKLSLHHCRFAPKTWCGETQREWRSRTEGRKAGQIEKKLGPGKYVVDVWFVEDHRDLVNYERAKRHRVYLQADDEDEAMLVASFFLLNRGKQVVKMDLIDWPEAFFDKQGTLVPRHGAKASPRQVAYLMSLINSGAWHDSDAGQGFHPPTRREVEQMSSADVSELIDDLAWT